MSEKSQGSLESQPALFPHLRGQVSGSQADQALALAASTQHACACVYGQGPPAGALVTQYPTHSAAGRLQATPWVWTGSCSEQVRHPAPPFPGGNPQHLPGRTDTHLERAGVWVRLWSVSVDMRLERPGEAMLGARGAGETQDSRLPPGACTRDLPNSCPSLLCLPGKGPGGGGWATWFREGRSPLPALQPSPIAFPFPPRSELDFEAITLNSMDATSERDFVGESWKPSRRFGFNP